MITAAALSIALASWPSQGPFANSYGNAGLQWGVTHTIDATKYGAPPNAKAVQMTGILIITHGTNQETCDLTVYARPSADQTWYGYKGQTIEAHVGGGQRSNHTLFVPLKDGKFQLYLSGAQGKPQWPQGCAYGVNYLIDYWLVEDE